MIRVVNWARHQHYKDRTPPWIKVYRKLLKNPVFLRADGYTVKVLLVVWLVASESTDGEIDASPEDLAFVYHLDQPSLARSLKYLHDNDFIECASNVLAWCNRLATPEAEAEAKGEGETEGERCEQGELSTEPSPMASLSAHAIKVLDDMRHPNSRRATARTLEASYLDPDDQSIMLDRSVHGLSCERRVELVSRALVEYGAQTAEWNARHFAAFVKRLRNAPRPGTEAATVQARGEPKSGGYRPSATYQEEEREGLVPIDARAILESFGVSAPRGQA